MAEPLRQATPAEITRSLGTLFTGLPLRRGNLDDVKNVYILALRNCTPDALQSVVLKLIGGEIEGMSKSFAPSPAELAFAVRTEGRSQADLLEAAKDYTPVPFLSLEMKIDAALQRMNAEGRERLAELNHNQTTKSRMREFPAGSVFVGILGAVYGPATQR